LWSTNIQQAGEGRWEKGKEREERFASRPLAQKRRRERETHYCINSLGFYYQRGGRKKVNKQLLSVFPSPFRAKARPRREGKRRDRDVAHFPLASSEAMVPNVKEKKKRKSITQGHR